MSEPVGTCEARAPGKTPARTIGALTRSVAARARQAHSARAVCGATAAACVVLACVVQRGGSVEDPDALILAAIAGALAYFAWRLSRSVAARDIARRVDGELGLRGAFIAAYETERERPNSAVAQLGAARLVACVRRRDAMEAAIPHTVGFVALPFLALAGLLFVVEARGAGTGGATAGTLTALTLSAGLGQIANQQGAALDDAQMEQLEQATQAAAGAATESGEQQRRDLADVAETLDSLAREAPPGSELAEVLSRAAAQAEAAALDDEGGTADGEEDVAVGGAEDADEGAATDGAATDGAATDGEATDGDATGRTGPERTDPVAGESGGADDAAVAADPTSPGPVAPTRTVGEIRWWSDRDASIVSRWIEIARRRTESPSDG